MSPTVFKRATANLNTKNAMLNAWRRQGTVNRILIKVWEYVLPLTAASLVNQSVTRGRALLSVSTVIVVTSSVSCPISARSPVDSRWSIVNRYNTCVNVITCFLHVYKGSYIAFCTLEHLLRRNLSLGGGATSRVDVSGTITS